MSDTNKRYNIYKRDPETTRFYKSAAWKKKRLYILKRDKYLCQICKRYGRNTEAVIVHHIEELSEAPELKLKNTNLVSVCRKCHNMIHKKENNSEYKGLYGYNKQK